MRARSLDGGAAVPISPRHLADQRKAELECPNCKQVFKCEHPYLSHTCFPENSAQLWRNFSAPVMVKSQSADQSTNLHSLARDLERRMATCKEGSHGERGVNCDEAENSQDRKNVLLEKTNCLYEEQHAGTREEGSAQHMLGGPFWKFRTGKQVVKKGAIQLKGSAFTEVRWMKEKLRTAKASEMGQGTGEAHLGKDAVQCSSGSAFSFVWPTGAPGEPKSAFSKPVKCLVGRRAAAASQHRSDPRKLSGCISATDIMWCSSSSSTSTLWASRILARDLTGSQLLQASLVQSRPFPPVPGLWPRQVAAQTHTLPAPASGASSASLALLPPTFTSFAVAAQNWCAKCNLSFRMTSDLVFHMRAHHKKEDASPESQGRRRREEKLACPVCQEYFRERHHLSRHMTSHN